MRYQLLDDNVKVITAKLQLHAWITALPAPCSPGFSGWPRRGDLPSVDRPIIITGHDRIGFRTWRMECYGKPLEDGTYGNLTAMPHAWNIAMKLHKCCTLETSWWNECSGCSTWGTACNWDTHRYNKPLQDDTCSDDTITTRAYMMLLDIKGRMQNVPTAAKRY